MEASGLKSKDWKKFTEEIRIKGGQYVVHSFRIYPEQLKKSKENSGGWPSKSFGDLTKETHQQLADMQEAGWKLLDIYPGNHAYGSNIPKACYYMVLMGLVQKPKKLADFQKNCPLFEKKEKPVTITAPVMDETVVTKIKRAVKKATTKRTTTKKELA
jgi:hypothetical protein